MNICGIRRRSLVATLFLPPVIGVLGALGLAGCGTGSTTYSPIDKVTGVTPGFSLVVTPPSVTAVQGAAASFIITLTETGGFNSQLAFSASGLPTGAAATFGAPTPTATGATVTMAVSTSNTVQAQENVIVAGSSKAPKPAINAAATRAVTPLGSSTISVTAVGGGITQTSNNVTLVVAAAPDFTVTLTPASPGSANVAPGSTAHFIATVKSIGSFSTPVSLSLAGLPQNTGPAAFGSATVTPTAAGATTTVDVPTSDSEGSTTVQNVYTLILTGKAGATSHTSTASFGVGSFTLTVTEATTGSGTVIQGGTARYIITVKSVNGFSPLVTLTAPALQAGCTSQFGSGTLTATPDGATTTMAIKTTGPGLPNSTPVSNPPGTPFDFSVGGQGGGWFTIGDAGLVVNSGQEQ